MKKYIYSFMAVLMVTMCSAQVVSLSQAEYFWDTDPGEGAGTALTAADGNFNSAFENIAATGLGAPSVGLHKFSVRVKDNTGAWSPAFVNVVKVEATTTPTPVSLAQAEYFWDTDPGEGNGSALSAADASFDSAFEKIAVSGVTMPAVGMHTLNIRIKDNQGVWSPVFTNVITVEAVTTPIPVSLTQAECFWDTDPGEGNGTPMTATDGNFNSAFEKFLQNGITIAQPVGLHTFNVRMKDNTGNWGPVFKNSVYIETLLANGSFDMPGLMVYPNPVKDILNISLDQGITGVSVYNLLGQQVITKSLDANEAGIDMSGLASGAYLVSIQSEGKIKTVKIIKE